STRKLFGSFLVLVELENFPYVAVSADAFRAKAIELHRTSSQCHAPRALQEGAELLERNGNTWSREIEDALYAAYGKTHPFASPPRKGRRYKRLHPGKQITR